jgi:hypothetical protein
MRRRARDDRYRRPWSSLVTNLIPGGSFTRDRPDDADRRLDAHPSVVPKGESMTRTTIQLLETLAISGSRRLPFVVALLAAAWTAQAQTSKTPYPTMAPADQYLMDRTAEIVLARSAAPVSISKDADVMVLGRHGYESAVKGKNGFVCVVERSWAAGIDDPQF